MRQLLSVLSAGVATAALVAGVTAGTTLLAGEPSSGDTTAEVCTVESAAVEQGRATVAARAERLRVLERQVERRQRAVRRADPPRADRRARVRLGGSRAALRDARRDLARARAALTAAERALAACRAAASASPTPAPTTASPTPSGTPAPTPTDPAPTSPTATVTAPPPAAPTTSPTGRPATALDPWCASGLPTAVCDAVPSLDPAPGVATSPLQPLCDEVADLQPLCSATVGQPDRRTPAGALPLQPLCDAGLPQEWCAYAAGELPDLTGLPPIPGVDGVVLPDFDRLVELLGVPRPR